MKAKKEKLTREEVAYHEAGHAVAMVHLIFQETPP